MSSAQIVLTGAPTRTIVISDPNLVQMRDDRSGAFIERREPGRIVELRRESPRTVFVTQPRHRTVYVHAIGPQGPQGVPGPGTARYVVALAGLSMRVAAAVHQLGVVRFVAVANPAGDDVSVAFSIAPDGSVTVSGLKPLDGYTLTLE